MAKLRGRWGTWLHAVLLVIGLGSIALALLLWVQSTERSAVTILACLALVTAGVAAYSFTPAVTKAQLGLSKARQPNISTYSNIGADSHRGPKWIMTDEELEHFIMALVSPKLVISRIRETVAPLSRAVDVRVDHTVAVPKNVSGDFYLPIVVLKKGRMLDRLIVSTDQSGALPVMAYTEALVMVMRVISRLVEDSGPLAYRDYKRNFQKEAFHLVSRRAPLSQEERDERSKYLGRLDMLLGQGDIATLVVSLVELLSEHYAQVVAVPASIASSCSTMHVSVSYRRIQDLDQPADQWFAPAYWMRRLRVALDVRPSAFAYPLENAARAPSYHLEFFGPENTYLARQLILGGTVEAPVEFGPQHGRYRRGRRRRGQRYGHIYLRMATEQIRIDSMNALFSFFERVPGSVGEAAIASLAATMLIFGGGQVLGRGDDPRGDLVAVLLAFPVTAASWIGLSRRGGVAGGVTASRLGSLLTFVLSMSAALTALGADVGVHFFDKWELMGTHAGWTWLLLCSACVSVSLLASWARRSSIYSTLLERRDRDEEY